jgi:uncharacterized protein (TIGR02118 family)
LKEEKRIMPDKPVINVVMTKCKPEDDVKFNKWYDEVHIPMLMKSKKLSKTVRYKVMETGKQPSFMAVYYFASQKDFEDFNKGPEIEAARKDMQEVWGQKVELTSRVQYEFIREWKK